MKLLGYFFVLILGFVLGAFLINIPYFKIDVNINILHLLSILSAIGTGLYIAVKIDKSKDDNRSKKNILIKELDIFQAMSNSLLDIIVKNKKIKYTISTSKLKRLRTHIDLIFKIVKETNVSIDDDLNNCFNKLMHELRDLLTNTPQKDENKNEDIYVEDNIIHYSDDRIDEIEVKFDELNEKNLILKLEINKA